MRTLFDPIAPGPSSGRAPGAGPVRPGAAREEERGVRRILSIQLPRFAVERALRAERRFELGGALDGAPVAAVAESAGRLRLAAVTAAGEAAGLAPGMALADARAIRPDLRSFLQDPTRDRAALIALARWAGRYSPWVGLDGPAALAIDSTGSAHLFGGEAALLEELRARLADFGLSARLGLADGKGAAWALAAGADDGAGPAPIAPPGESRRAIAALPVAALRLAPETVAALRRLGIERVETLLAQPRGPLARRFGTALTRRLDQALGAEPEPIAPLGPAPVFAVRLAAPEPLIRRADLTEGLRRLLARLCARLHAEGRGARGLVLHLRRVDGEIERIEIGLARPGREPARLLELLEQALADFQAAFGVDALRLEARPTAPLAERQTHAGPAFRDGPDAAEPDALGALLTRLGGRLGFERLTRLSPLDSHAPEAAVARRPAAETVPSADWPAAAAARPPRPLSALAPEPIRTLQGGAAPGRPPARFLWRGAAHRTAAAFGPERLTPEWWRAAPGWNEGLRDYWRLETEDGLRLWLRHAPQAAEPPDWVVCGVFA